MPPTSPPSDPVPAPRLDDALLRPVTGANALEQSVARLLQTVRLGAVAPGDALPSERELALSLGVSRDTVREAIRELTSAGWLVTRRGRYGGTFVVDPPPTPRTRPRIDDLEEVLGLRAVLEPGAARAAAERALSAAERDALRGSADECADAGTADYRRLDSRLHLTVAQLSGLPSLAMLVAENRIRVNELLDAFPLLPGNVSHSTRQHETLVGAILAGRPDDAEAAMREHLAGSAELLRGFLV